MQEVWIMDAQRFASSASPAQPFGRSLRTGRRVRAGQFLQACPNGDPGEPGRFGYAAHPSSSHGAGFYRCPRAACALIQERPQDDKLCCNGLACWVLHRADRNTSIREMDRLFWRASLVMPLLFDYKFTGIRLRRDSWVSVKYAEGLNSSQSSAIQQRTDRHGILGQKPTDLQLSL